MKQKGIGWTIGVTVLLLVSSSPFSLRWIHTCSGTHIYVNLLWRVIVLKRNEVKLMSLKDFALSCVLFPTSCINLTFTALYSVWFYAKLPLNYCFVPFVVVPETFYQDLKTPKVLVEGKDIFSAIPFLRGRPCFSPYYALVLIVYVVHNWTWKVCFSHHFHGFFYVLVLILLFVILIKLYELWLHRKRCRFLCRLYPGIPFWFSYLFAVWASSFL